MLLGDTLLGHCSAMLNGAILFGLCLMRLNGDPLLGSGAWRDFARRLLNCSYPMSLVGGPTQRLLGYSVKVLLGYSVQLLGKLRQPLLDKFFSVHPVTAGRLVLLGCSSSTSPDSGSERGCSVVA